MSGGIFATRAEAETMLSAMRVERAALLAEGTLSAKPEGPLTVGTWGAKWLDRRERARVVRNPDDDRRVWKRYIASTPLASIALEDVRGKDVRDWLRGMLERRTKADKPLATQSVRNTLNLLRCALSDAAAEELIATNPAAGVKVPVRREPQRFTYLDVAEVNAVLTCEKMPADARRLFTVAMFTGMRAGELWALTWGDVTLDGDRPEIVVRRSHQHAPKNGKERSIPLFPQARKALEELKAARDNARREALKGAPQSDSAEEDDGATDLVFPAPLGGQRLRGDDAGWNSRKVRSKPHTGHREAAKIMRPVPFKAFRATCGSHLVMGSWTPSPWPIADVSKFLGHASIGVTEKHYAKLAPGYLHDRVREVGAPVSLSVSVRPEDKDTGNAFSSSHPRDLNPRPTVYETVQQPLSARGFEHVVALQGPYKADTAALAEALLRAVDEGTPAGDLARALAVEVLATTSPSTVPWLRALAVVEGGAQRMRHAVELAGQVLEVQASARVQTG